MDILVLTDQTVEARTPGHEFTTTFQKGLLAVLFPILDLAQTIGFIDLTSAFESQQENNEALPSTARNAATVYWLFQLMKSWIKLSKKAIKKCAFFLMIAAIIMVQCVVIKAAYEDHLAGKDITEALFPKLPLIIMHIYRVMGIWAVRASSFRRVVEILKAEMVGKKRMDFYKWWIGGAANAGHGDFEWKYLNRSKRFVLRVFVFRGVLLTAVIYSPYPGKFLISFRHIL